MKKFLLSLTSLLSLLLVSCTETLIVDQSSPATLATKADNSNQSVEPISFISLVASDSWQKAESFLEKSYLCELPEGVLMDMTTESLLETCINHPLANLFYTYDDHLLFIDVLVKYNNVFQAFLSRNDATDVALQLYDRINVIPMAKEGVWDDKGYSTSILSQNLVELVIGSGYLTDILSEKHKSTLASIAEKWIKKKLEAPDIYSYASLESSFLLYELASREDTLLTQSVAKEVYSSLYDKYVQPMTKVSLLGTTTVYTLFGQPVQGLYFSELNNSEINERIDEVYTFDPNADIVSGPTATYNCHSYAWNICDGGETCWINPYDNNSGENVSKYWTHDYYGSTTMASLADKLVYFYGAYPAHSAIYYSSGVWESKWGDGPIVRHSLSNVPYVYNATVYYKQTVHTVSLDVPATEIVGVPILCSPDWFVNVDHTSCVWHITDQHENETGYTQNPSGLTNTITFTQTGAFQIACDVYWYSTLVGHAEEEVIITY